MIPGDIVPRATKFVLVRDKFHTEMKDGMVTNTHIIKRMEQSCFFFNLFCSFSEISDCESKAATP